MMNKQVVIVGGGGHGKVVADIVKKSGDTFRGFLDDNRVDDDVIGRIDEWSRFADCCFVIAIGDNETRRRLMQKYSQMNLHTAIHPNAVIGDSVEIGKGTVVMAGAVVNSNAKIGDGCIINTGAIVEHDCRISDFVHISPGAVLCGTVVVGENTHIGAGVVVKNNIMVSKDVIVGVGAVVVKNIEESGKYAGVPARRLRNHE